MSGWSPAWTSPVRWEARTSSVSGRYVRGPGPLRQPPATAGTQPFAPVRALSHRIACTSSRPANNDRNSASFSSTEERESTGPEASVNNGNRAGTSGSSEPPVIPANRISRAFSPCSRPASARNTANSVSSDASDAEAMTHSLALPTLRVTDRRPSTTAAFSWPRLCLGELRLATRGEGGCRPRPVGRGRTRRSATAGRSGSRSSCAR